VANEVVFVQLRYLPTMFEMMQLMQLLMVNTFQDDEANDVVVEYDAND
jgi:hypothetical protein